MAWNNGNSILGTGESYEEVVRESDVIFSALFIGTVSLQRTKLGGKAWRVDMEPDIEKPGEKERTAEDRKSMKTLNDTCTKINFILDPSGKKTALEWGLTPLFDRGGMIYGGENAKLEYGQVNKKYAQFAYRYLTASHRAATFGQRDDEMYIGRGAYCGLVIDDQGNAVTAMSTVRTTLNERTHDAGNRWKPGLDAAVRKGQYRDESRSATWGIIHSLATQKKSQEEGMRFFPRVDGEDIPLKVEKDIVGYTHGMIRSMYEIERIGLGNPFEMSIGTQTYKLASCVPCSTFMLANGIAASSTHLGRGESWSPLFSGESNTSSHYPDQKDPDDADEGVTIAKAIKRKNNEHSIFMHNAMTAGVEAMWKSLDWIEKRHHKALKNLATRLEEDSKSSNTVARDLFLDALTIHKSDMARLDHTIVIPESFDKQTADLDWSQPSAKNWRAWDTIYTDDDIAMLHTPPEITYRITAYSDEEEPCDLDFLLMDGAERMHEGKLAQAISDPSKWFFEFKAAEDVLVEAWDIKIGRAAVHRFRLDENTVIDSKHSYIVNSLSR
jgi:hypothetical protein